MRIKIFVFILALLLCMPFAAAEELTVGESFVSEDYKLEIKLVEMGTGYADLELSFSERESYDGYRDTAVDNGYRPNPNNYKDLNSDLLSQAKVLYRTHWYCDGRLRKDLWKNGKQIMELNGYRNYLCRSREYEQCHLDGSFDTYYEEHCDYGVIRFSEGQTKYSLDFGLKLVSINGDKAVVEVISKGSQQTYNTQTKQITQEQDIEETLQEIKVLLQRVLELLSRLV